MLEALIRTKSSPCSDKRAGDIICVKLKEFADWGSMEIRVHKVVDWEDKELEKSMRDYFDLNGIFPVETTPYKIMEECVIKDQNGQEVYGGPVTKTRSIKYFDIEENTQKEKSSEQIGLEFEFNKLTKLNQINAEKPIVERELSSLEIEERILIQNAEKAENPDYIYQEIERKKQIYGGA